MACCNRNLREHVNEEEERINAQGEDIIPVLLKVISILVVAVGLSIGLSQIN
ncbi:hypothetical protein [Bacillus solimangrovi]|uniref:hypothetical protein n=1 Tax=Bacillus solimangrovi TaxID=1305675 RepID=UPI001585EF14|nr:hypothetical protein [Bacillus solimangrovi]